MKELTREEFTDRVGAEMRARAIFIESGVTESITIAFEIYQKILATTDRRLSVSIKRKFKKPASLFDKFVRPICPDCGQDFYFRPLPQNNEGFQVQLVCSNPDCDLVLNSTLTMQDWEKELVLKNDDRFKGNDPSE